MFGRSLVFGPATASNVGLRGKPQEALNLSRATYLKVFLATLLQYLRMLQPLKTMEKLRGAFHVSADVTHKKYTIFVHVLFGSFYICLSLLLAALMHVSSESMTMIKCQNKS